jgi:predicted DNA-binding transcriptional regulator AlpA
MRLRFLFLAFFVVLASIADDDRWLSIKDLSERYQLPIGTIRDWRHRGTGPRGVRFGNAVRFRLSEVLRWEAERERASQGQVAS